MSSSFRSEDGRDMIKQWYQEYLRQEVQPLGWSSSQIDTSFGKTHLLRLAEPEKPPLFFLHGSMSNALFATGLASLFAPSFSLYSVDIPGEPGLSSDLRLSLSKGEARVWLTELLDTLKVDRVFILGVSLGSWYALEFAQAHPERVRALSLITTGGIVRQRGSFIPKALFCLLLGKRGERLLERMIYRGAEVPDSMREFSLLVKEHFLPMSERLPLFTDEQLLRLDMPLHYIAGKADILLDSKGSAKRLSSLLPDSRIELTDQGHVITDRFGECHSFFRSVLSQG